MSVCCTLSTGHVLCILAAGGPEKYDTASIFALGTFLRHAHAHEPGADELDTSKPTPSEALKVGTIQHAVHNGSVCVLGAVPVANLFVAESYEGGRVLSTFST